ncbi:MAG: adenylate/guanylate cyclase domain-containing protein [Candidatus Binatia bacterium]
MTFDEILAQVQELLQREKRVSYRGLKRRFAVDDEYIEDLKEELIGAKRLASDEDGRFLVWLGGEAGSETAKGGNGETERRGNAGDSLASRVQSLAPEGQEQASLLQTLNSRPRDSRQDGGERRQLTVMFIDLVGSTTLSQQLDPEDYQARVVAYQTACHHVVARYAGHIAQYLGDGVLVYFGYPTAHEDDAIRAVRSGLEIVTAVRQLTYTPALQVRIGIHTGPVVIGEIGSSERREILAMGETPNIAAAS